MDFTERVGALDPGQLLQGPVWRHRRGHAQGGGLAPAGSCAAAADPPRGARAQPGWLATEARRPPSNRAARRLQPGRVPPGPGARLTPLSPTPRRPRDPLLPAASAHASASLLLTIFAAAVAGTRGWELAGSESAERPPHSRGTER